MYQNLSKHDKTQEQAMINDILFYYRYTLSDGSKYTQVANSEKHAHAHAKKLSSDARFGGVVEVLKRTLGADAQLVCIYKNGIKS